MLLLSDQTVIISLDTGAEQFNQQLPPGSVNNITFLGLAGDDFFRNTTNIPTEGFGNSGNDTLVGGGGSDVFIGGLGNDRLFGNGGFDGLRGNDGDDFISGGDVADAIFGGAGNDRLNGGNGNDEICLLYTSPSPRDATLSRMPSSA